MELGAYAMLCAYADGPRDALCLSLCRNPHLTAAQLRCTTNRKTNRSSGVIEGYSRPICDKLCVQQLSVECRRCNSQARPSTNLVDNDTDLLYAYLFATVNLWTFFSLL